MQEVEGLTKQNGGKAEDLGAHGGRDGEPRRDFYAECVAMSVALEQGPDKPKRLQANSE